MSWWAVDVRTAPEDRARVSAWLVRESGHAVEERPDGLLVTELRPTSPFLLLNVSMGDRAEVEARQCGCPLEQYGWTRHLHTIRSQEKLTAAGVTFLDTDVVRVLEELLPSRFGGGPTHYQLLEEESEDGSPTLRLLVDRTSLEIFADGGAVYMPMAVIFPADNRRVSIAARGGEARIDALTIHELKSAWQR